MKCKWTTFVSTGLLALHANACAAHKPEPAQVARSSSGTRILTNWEILAQKDKVGYAIGVAVARNLQRQQMDVSADAVAQGLHDVLAGRSLRISDGDVQAILSAYQTESSRKHAIERGIGAMVARKEGVEFLARNKAKPGVVSLPSGLQYEVRTIGKGRRPKDADAVECRYRGTLIDGTEFGHSGPNDRPAVLKVGGLIPGWREALERMPVGSTWRLFIPPSLAYGRRGSGTRIGPNATLIIDVELLAVR